MKISYYYIIISVGIIGIVCYFNYINIIEAYGNGAPHYDRTTNMDKWQNPIPMLIAVNLLVIAGIIFGLFKMSREKRSNKNN